MFRWTLHNVDTGETQKIKYDPDGWRELVLTHQRDSKWHGIGYDFTTELGFYCKGGGKEFVDQAYENKGQEANVTIKAEIRINGTWSNLFTGKLNFSVYREEYKSNVLYTFLDAERDDVKKLINNREDLEVDLLRNTSLDGVTLNDYPYLGYDITMHSRIIHIESEWETLTHGCCFHLISTGLRLFYIIPTTNLLTADFEKSLETESRCVNPVVFDGFLDDAQPIVNTANSPIFLQPQTVRITWNIAGTIKITTTDTTPIPSDPCEDNTCGTGALTGALYDSVDMALRLFFGNDSNETEDGTNCSGGSVVQGDVKFLDLVVEPTFAVTGNPTIKSFSGSGSVDVIMNPEDKAWYYWVMDMNLINSCDMKMEFDYTVSELKIESDTMYHATNCRSIGIHEAWSRLSEIITDQQLGFRSELFGRTNSNITYPQDGCGSRVAITSGKNIRRLGRGATVFTPPIKMSLSKMFESVDAIYGIGLGIEKYNNFDVLRVEELSYFYSDTEILKLDFVPNIQIKHLSDRVYNEISLGFEKWSTTAGQTNGLDEPLTKIKYIVPPIKSNKKKFEKISKFVASMYSIEITRRSGDETKRNTEFDEDAFIIALSNDDMTICEKDENMTSVTNLLSPETAYNLRFLLSSTFDRLKNQFTAGLTKLGTLADPILMPAQGEGNQSVTYAYVANGCAGDHFGTTQTNGDAGKYPDAQARREAPIFLPQEITFDWPLSYTDYLKIVANPYGLIRFSSSNKNYMSGWILNLDYQIAIKHGTFRILRKYDG